MQKNSGIVKKKEHYEVSVYSGKLDNNIIIDQFARIKRNWPVLEEWFYRELAERIKANNFTSKRLIDAVSRVIDEFCYKTPSIADFISFDLKIQTYTYNQLIDLNNRIAGNVFILFPPVNFNGAKLYVSVEDIERYKLELWSK